MSQPAAVLIPPIYTTPQAALLPSVSTPATKTSQEQDATVAASLAHLRAQASPPGAYNRYGVQQLLRAKHVVMLYDMLESFPKSFTSLDASRPWMVYWSTNALAMLGEDVTALRDRCIATLAPMQSPGGGFGGGHGQYAHAAPTYAAVLTLALLEDAKAYDLIDRNALWRWAASCKQPDGGFTMAVGGEEDIRAPYCIMTCVSLLNLPLELPEDCPARREWGFTKFTDGLAEYISSCQTFEGGISGSPGVEAHAAYAFCALATLAIMGEPHDLFHRHLDMPLLLDWLSADQHAPEGGFAGRTNKLVDGCYSHWAGGCWPLVEAAVRMKHGAGREIAGEWRGLFDRQGLARWILNCCQETKWGLLRDKIGKPPDAYHTNYNLAGLAGMQWRSWYSSSTGDRDGDGDGSEPPRPAPYRWECEKVPIPEKSAASAEEVADLQVVWEPGDQLQPVHPVFVIGHAAVRKIRGYFEERPLR